MRYKVDDKNVAYQEVDGEVIAINFPTGAYFSMQRTAAAIWQMLLAGLSPSLIVERYRDTASVTGDMLEGEINSFVEELLAAKLIEPDGPVSGETTGANPAEPVRDYVTPQLEKFEDMAELIMLDPVHDVSEAGWPHQPGNGN